MASEHAASIPLPLLLEWAEVHGSALAGERDGVAMFYALLAEIDQDHDRPHDAR